jgi:hypothetical protein
LAHKVHMIRTSLTRFFILFIKGRKIEVWKIVFKKADCFYSCYRWSNQTHDFKTQNELTIKKLRIQHILLLKNQPLYKLAGPFISPTRPLPPKSLRTIETLSHTNEHSENNYGQLGAWFHEREKKVFLVFILLIFYHHDTVLPVPFIFTWCFFVAFIHRPFNEYNNVANRKQLK